MEEKVIIYTDGACSGNPGPGGWGAILMYKGAKKEISGGKKDTTNNIMEVTAVIEALKCLKVKSDVQVYSDSAYTVNAFNQKWIYGWIKKGWKTAGGDPVKNKELWQELYSLTQKHNVEFIKVKGHADNEYNKILLLCLPLAKERKDFCYEKENYIYYTFIRFNSSL